MRRLAWLALLAFVACLPFGAMRADAQPAPTLIRFGTGPDDASVPLLYAVKAGIYKKYGLDVQLVRLAGASAVASAVAGGSLEMGKASSLSTVTAIGRGLPFTVIGNLAYYDSDRPTIALVVAAGSSIHSPKDLAGKTLGAVSLQDMNSLATFAWLDRAGVDYTSVKYVELPASAVLAALDQNRIVGSTIYEPYYSSYVASGKVRVLGYPLDAIARHFSDALIFTTVKWAAEHPDAVDRFLKASEEASRYIAAHENLATQLIADFGSIDPSTIASYHHDVRGIAVSAAEIQPMIDAAAKYKLIPKVFPASEMLCGCALLKK